MAMPEKSPLLAQNVVCGNCGTILEPKVIMGPRGVTHVQYECRNSKHDPYQMDSFQMLCCEMKPIRDDGTVVKL